MIKLTREKLLTSMSLISDEPNIINDDFKFNEYAEQIFDLLTSEKMIYPFTVAIHAYWGMGKTTLLKMIIDKFGNDNADKKIIEFDAWDYERLDVVVSLFSKIRNKLDPKDIVFSKSFKNTIMLLSDVLARKSLGMTLEEAREHFDTNEPISQLRESLKKLTKDTKLIIFIDDLDRCSAENILNILEIVKIFLNVKNIIVVMAMDIRKLERAWELRYDNKAGKIEGKEYLEKLFPLKLTLPLKSPINLTNYIKTLVPTLPDSFIETIVINSQPNPRKIKHMLNLLYVILKTLPDRGESTEEKNKNFKIDFKILTAYIALILNHRDFVEKIQTTPSHLVTISVLCRHIDTFTSLKNFMRKLNSKVSTHTSGEFTIYEGRFEIYSNILRSNILRLLEEVGADYELFKILQNLGHIFEPNEYVMNTFHLEITSKYLNSAHEKFDKLLNKIMNQSGLIGV